MAANLYGQYVWLIDTIRSAGRIKKSDIDKRWAKSSLNEKNETVYPLRSFHRHKDAIRQLFGLIIGCDMHKGNYTYYISNFDELSSNGYRSHLLKSLEFSNQLMDTTSDIKKRILFEPLNDGSIHLATIFTAMREKLTLRITFLPEFGGGTIEAIPYILKEKDFFWYLAAKNLYTRGVEETQVFALREVAEITVTSNKATMPRHFNGEIFFNSYFGTLEKAASKKRAPKEDKPKVEKPKVEKKPKAEKKASKPVEFEAPNVEQLSLF